MMTSNHPRRYRHKPIFVEAIIFNGGAESAKAVKEWAAKHDGTVTHHPGTQGTGSVAMPRRPERLKITRTSSGAKSGVLFVEPGEVIYFSNDRFVKVAGHEFVAEWDLDEQETLLGGTIEQHPIVDGVEVPDAAPDADGAELQPEPATPDNATTPLPTGGFTSLSADDLTGGSGDEDDEDDDDPGEDD